MKKIISILMALTLTISLAACTGDTTGKDVSSSTSSSQASSEVTFSEAVSSEASDRVIPTVDPSGAEIKLPETINSVISMAPSATETLVALGCADKIIAIDTQSTSIAGIKENLPAFDMMQPDAEQLAVLTPDVIFVSNMSVYNSENPFKTLQDMGTTVVVVPTSENIAGIKTDIQFFANVMDKASEGEKIIATLDEEINKIAEIAKTVTEKKTVYFEIAAAPAIYSFGTGTFINEMIELVGATNALGDKEGWLSVEAEVAVKANADVILTNVNYIEDPVAEILSRQGFGEMDAVKNKQVFYIDNMSSSLPTHNMVKALKEIAVAVYPDLYK